MSPDERAIRELVEQWMSATQSGDLDVVLDLMTDDVTFLVPGKEPFGKSAFAEASRTQAKGAVTFEGHSEPIDLQINGDLAVMISKLQVTVSQPDKSPMRRAGYTLTVLRKRGDQWRISRDANLLGPADSGSDA